MDTVAKEFNIQGGFELSYFDSALSTTTVIKDDAMLTYFLKNQSSDIITIAAVSANETSV